MKAYRAWPASAALAAGLIACGGSREPPAKLSAPPAAAPVESAAGASPKPPRLAPRAPGAEHAPRLPEDPAAGARASKQWDAHLAHEEEKRQLVFDRDRMALHRAALALIASARARYDKARSESALEAARRAVQPQLAKIKERLAELDPWANSSGLLAEYAALQAALAESYPAAKLASLRGDAAAFTAAQASFDQRLAAAREWLERAARAKGEGEEDEDEASEEHARATAHR